MNCAPFQTMVMRNNHGGNEPCTDQGLGLLWDYIMLFSFCTELFYKKRKSRPEFVPDESATRLTEPSSFDNTEEQGSCNEYARKTQKMSGIKTPVRPDSVLRPLAEIYPQLYLTPGEEGAKLWSGIVGKGLSAPSSSLDHFHGSPQDSVNLEKTPAGSVMAVTLGDRQDFELFLQIMANKCVPTAIPATQGASILDGVINWQKIRDHEKEYLAAGGTEEGWSEEFRRFTSDKKNYRDALIVLSTGPYSAVPASKTGMEEKEWLAASLTIRKNHECTHFICRRLFPEKIDAIWDELVADAVGLYAAFGRYDLSLASLFLGAYEDGYRPGGRLENYVKEDEDINELNSKAVRTLRHLDECIRTAGSPAPYDLAIILENEYDRFWKNL